MRHDRLNRIFSVPSGSVPQIFGILNLSADSFSGNGSVEDPVPTALQMLEDGADAIDIGAESTRPGAKEIPVSEEINRLVPVIEALRAEAPDCVISVDTRKALAAEAALSAGADMINDVSGLVFDPAMAETVARYNGGLILMHMRGTPETMQLDLEYENLTGEINAFFARQIELAVSAGIDRRFIALDPGVGFAKSAEQNFELIRDAEKFRCHDLPLFYGISRKSFLQKIRQDARDRDFCTGGVLAYLTAKRIEFVRVHNVRLAHDVMAAYALCECGGKRL